jgi:hypothetical protein
MPRPVHFPSRTAPRRRWLPAWPLALVLAGLQPPVARAEPAPVLPGLWEVTLLTTHDGAADRVAPPPQRRQYRICLNPARARAPMTPPPGAAQAEVLLQRQGISGSYLEPGAAGQRRAVEFAYRRLDAGTFEGSHDAETADTVRRTQYLARRVSPDCGALQPQPAAATGEP